MKERPYQVECREAIESAFEDHDSCLVELPTGTGKTIVFSKVAQRWENGRTLIICPKIELVSQTAKKLEQVTGEWPGIEQASNWSDESPWVRSDYVVASKDTLTAGKNRKRYERFQDVGLVVVDEAHLSATRIWKEVLDHFASQGAKLLGVTATAKRHDKRSLGQIFEHCAYQYSIEDAMDDGWLVPCKATCCQVESLDLSGVATVAGDFHGGDLSEKLADQKVVYEVSDITARESKGQRTIVYCKSVLGAQQIAYRLKDRYAVQADFICSDTKLCTQERREQVLSDFAQGTITHVCNVGILTIGYDLPDLQCLVMARPTKSLTLYTQMFGRGTRPLDGLVDPWPTDADRKAAIEGSRKPYFRVIDLVDNALNHTIQTATDVFAGRYTLDDVPTVKHNLKSADPRKALAKAQKEEEEEKEQAKRLEEQRRQESIEAERKRQARCGAKVTYTKQDVDPFGNHSGVEKTDRRVARMTFGKHKGQPLSSIDTGYLQWAQTAVTTRWLVTAIQRELERRKGRVVTRKLDFQEMFDALRT